MRALTCAWIAAAIFTGGAQAADEPIDKGYRGQFVRAGGAFACNVDKSQNVKPEDMDVVAEQACLHMGELAIGSDATLIKNLGEPDTLAMKRPG